MKIAFILLFLTICHTSFPQIDPFGAESFEFKERIARYIDSLVIDYMRPPPPVILTRLYGVSSSTTNMPETTRRLSFNTSFYQFDSTFVRNLGFPDILRRNVVTKSDPRIRFNGVPMISNNTPIEPPSPKLPDLIIFSNYERFESIKNSTEIYRECLRSHLTATFQRHQEIFKTNDYSYYVDENYYVTKHLPEKIDSFSITYLSQSEKLRYARKKSYRQLVVIRPLSIENDTVKVAIVEYSIKKKRKKIYVHTFCGSYFQFSFDCKTNKLVLTSEYHDKFWELTPIKE